MFSPRIPSARNAPPRKLRGGAAFCATFRFIIPLFYPAFISISIIAPSPPACQHIFKNFFIIFSYFFAIRYNLRRSCAYSPAKAKEENSRVQKEKDEGTHPHRTAIQRIPDGAQRRTSDDGFGRRRKAPPAKIERRTRHAARGAAQALCRPPCRKKRRALRGFCRAAHVFFFSFYPSCAPSIPLARPPLPFRAPPCRFAQTARCTDRSKTRAFA